jgi:hypothetical protein
MNISQAFSLLESADHFTSGLERQAVELIKREYHSLASQLAAQKREGDSVNPIDSLVNRFSEALRKKLHAAEAKYGYDHGFQRKDWRDACVEQLHLHLAKGDPRDVAAYCAFAWDHGWSLSEPAIRALTMSDEWIDQAKKLHAKCNHWPEASDEGFMALIGLRNHVELLLINQPPSPDQDREVSP